MTKTLPSRPDLEWLRKSAKERLAEMRRRDPSAKLHQAQLELRASTVLRAGARSKAQVEP